MTLRFRIEKLEAVAASMPRKKSATLDLDKLSVGLMRRILEVAPDISQLDEEDRKAFLAARITSDDPE